MNAPPASSAMPDNGLRFNLLDEPLIRWRRLADGVNEQGSLPQLFAAMVDNQVRDFPALRPHQRHPWHAFLCQLAAIALRRAGRANLYATAGEWRAALLALTPDDADGAAWCLVSPPVRPALLQAPAPEGIAHWHSRFEAADELDMLVTSKNHDIKSARVRYAMPEDWFFALLSLQTQEGFLGAGNYGISRMNGGFASRPGVGVVPVAAWGRRWQRDVGALLSGRDRMADERGLALAGGHALLWLQPWDGETTLAFESLDPLYIEICRRLRLCMRTEVLQAVGTGSKAPRVAAKALNGVTGDPWMPIETTAGKALTIGHEGFHYKLVVELLFGSKYSGGIAQTFLDATTDERVGLLARGVARGQGKTEGYHERTVPVSPKVRRLLASGQRETLARIARDRIDAIAEMRKLLWAALVTLFNNGASGGDASDSVKDKAGDFSRPFERHEDGRFFDDLTDEVESDDPAATRLQWLVGLAERAEAVLRNAFVAGPRSGMQRYRARAAALSRFHGTLRGPKSPLPDLANHYRQPSTPEEEFDGRL